VRFNDDQFFDQYRKQFGSLNALQANGLALILSKVENDSRWTDLRQLAYFFASIHHETNIKRNNLLQTFNPIVELRANKSKQPALYEQQNRYWLSGYYGRGLIQLTWLSNYKKFGLENDPNQALDPNISYEITVRGMIEGLFSGKKLSDYINKNKADYRNARRIVNALDKADAIAAIAVKWEKILVASKEIESTLPTPTEKPPEPPKPELSAIEQQTPVEVKASESSLGAKIAAAGPAIGTAISGMGLKLGGVTFNAWTIIAFCSVLIIGIIVGAILWDRSQERALRKSELNANTLADPTKHNVIIK